MKRISKTTLIEKLIRNAYGESSMYPDAKNRLKGDRRKLGERIEKLSIEERDILSSCSSDDFYHRLD